MSIFSRTVTPEQYAAALALIEQSKTEAVDAKKLKNALYHRDKYDEAAEVAAMLPDEREMYDKVKKYRDIISPAFNMFRAAMPDEISKAIPDNLIAKLFRYIIRPERLIDDINAKIESLAASVGIPSSHISIMVSKASSSSDALFEVMVFNSRSDSWQPVRYDLRTMLREKRISENFADIVKEDMLKIYRAE